ncbi:hypothetical protein CUR00_19535, partial [Acinetobacter baumannii]|uniref:hypothetical protein n=1 Tax=Acinetobacter baumannii TaxID=470 RepID=UPI001D0DF202
SNMNASLPAGFMEPVVHHNDFESAPLPPAPTMPAPSPVTPWVSCCSKCGAVVAETPTAKQAHMKFHYALDGKFGDVMDAMKTWQQKVELVEAVFEEAEESGDYDAVMVMELKEATMGLLYGDVSE